MNKNNNNNRINTNLNNKNTCQISYISSGEFQQLNKKNYTQSRDNQHLLEKKNNRGTCDLYFPAHNKIKPSFLLIFIYFNIIF